MKVKISNNKIEINDISNLDRPHLPVTKIGNKNWENSCIAKGEYENGKICE